jgi:protoheme IX farnesyltransferase
VVYTLWLKRATTLNIVIGGAAGAVPPLVGWAAVTHGVGGPALGLFALIFLWTPPHFWALALDGEHGLRQSEHPDASERARRGTHEKRDLRLLDRTRRRVARAHAARRDGPLVFRGGRDPRRDLPLRRVEDVPRPDKPLARVLFKYSLLYLALMCAAMVVDRVIG